MKLKLMLLGVLCLLLVTPVMAQQTDTTVYATAQRFERGLMIWRSDTGQIWALSNDGLAFSFPVSAYQNLPDNPIFGTPPSRLRPIFGFGKVWGNNEEIRSRLGWPTLAELGFDMPIRSSGGTYYLTQLDQSVIQINPDLTWHSFTQLPGEPAVISVGYSPQSIKPGGTMEVFWMVNGTDVALVEVYDVGTNELLALVQNLPLTGSTAIAIPTSVTRGVNIVVWGANRPNFPSPVTMWERVVSSSLTAGIDPLPVTPAPTTTTQAAFQQYQNGFMIWQANTGMVQVFYGSTNGTLNLWFQNQYETLPDNPIIDIPDGFVRPINGFGRVWGNDANVRDGLGWAVGAEQSYTLNIGNEGMNYTYNLPDGRTVHAKRVMYLTSLIWDF